MKQTGAILGALAGLALAGCATGPGGDPAVVERIDAITRSPARTETETPEQKARRELREQAFGEKIGLLSERDAYDPPRLAHYVAPRLPVGSDSGAPPPGAEVAVIIDTTGKVTDARIVSSTNPALVAPALDAVKQWRFTPGRKDGQLIGMSFIFPVVFEPR
jgi:protein TonB